ncbi:MAG: zinc-ribbon domain-containing protein [Bradymonadia bacterium]
MVKCPKCGTPAPTEANFCGMCGSTLRTDEPPVSPLSRATPVPGQAPVSPRETRSTVMMGSLPVGVKEANTRTSRRSSTELGPPNLLAEETAPSELLAEETPLGPPNALGKDTLFDGSIKPPLEDESVLGPTMILSEGQKALESSPQEAAPQEVSPRDTLVAQASPLAVSPAADAHDDVAPEPATEETHMPSEADGPPADEADTSAEAATSEDGVAEKAMMAELSVAEAPVAEAGVAEAGVAETAVEPASSPSTPEDAHPADDAPAEAEDGPLDTAAEPMPAVPSAATQLDVVAASLPEEHGPGDTTPRVEAPLEENPTLAEIAAEPAPASAPQGVEDEPPEDAPSKDALGHEPTAPPEAAMAEAASPGEDTGSRDAVEPDTAEPDEAKADPAEPDEPESDEMGSAGEDVDGQAPETDTQATEAESNDSGIQMGTQLPSQTDVEPAWVKAEAESRPAPATVPDEPVIPQQESSDDATEGEGSDAQVSGEAGNDSTASDGSPSDGEHETSQADPSEDGEAAPGKGGRFRETLWFMESLDPENMAAHDGDDPEAINAHYDREKEKSVDEGTRRQFSLQSKEPPTQTQMHRAVKALESEPEGKRSNPLVPVLILLAAAGIGVAVWLMTRGG